MRLARQREFGLPGRDCRTTKMRKRDARAAIAANAAQIRLCVKAIIARLAQSPVEFEPTIRFQVCTLFQWLVGSERLQRRPAGVALERGCDVFDDLFLRHFSER